MADAPAPSLPVAPPVNPEAAKLSAGTTFGYWDCEYAIQVLGVERAGAAAKWCAARAVSLSGFVGFFQSLTERGAGRG